MKLLIIFYGTIIAQTQCRSLLPAASMDDTEKIWNSQETDVKEEETGLSLINSPDVYIPVNFATAETELVEKKSWENSRELKPFIVTQARKFEKMLLEFAEKSGNGNDLGIRAGQLLKQLKAILKEFTGEEMGNSKHSDAKQSADSSSVRKTLQDILSPDENFGVFYRDPQDKLARYEDSVALPSVSHPRISSENATGNNKNEADQLDDMLHVAQNQIARIRKYFDVICRKHHRSMGVVPPEVDHDQANFEIPQPKKLSIL